MTTTHRDDALNRHRQRHALIDNPGPVALADVELDWTPVFAADEAGRRNQIEATR